MKVKDGQDIALHLTGELTGYGNEYFYLKSKGYELIDGKMVFKEE